MDTTLPVLGAQLKKKDTINVHSAQEKPAYLDMQNSTISCIRSWYKARVEWNTVSHCTEDTKLRALQMTS